MEPCGPRVNIVETHVSVIALIGDRAYKLLKPVNLGFLDHRRREDRLAACRRETEVNRRFAPDVYLGVLDVMDADGFARDHLVEMRRMPASRSLAALLDAPGADDLVREVARDGGRLPPRQPHLPADLRGGLARVRPGALGGGVSTDWRRSAPGVVPADEVVRARELATAYLAGRRPLLERRIAEGWVRDGHGDILCDDVFCLPDGPRVLDCLAFDDRLRHGDVLGDVAFLAMDMRARGRRCSRGRSSRSGRGAWASATRPRSRTSTSPTAPT